MTLITWVKNIMIFFCIGGMHNGHERPCLGMSGTANARQSSHSSVHPLVAAMGLFWSLKSTFPRNVSRCAVFNTLHTYIVQLCACECGQYRGASRLP